jgi:type IV secretory pathway VirJ component
MITATAWLALSASGAQAAPGAATAKAAFTVVRMKSAAGPAVVLRPTGAIRGMALFLSGDGGWITGLAEAMAQRGLIVAKVSTPIFLKSLETGNNVCVNPNYALLGMGQDIQHKLGLLRYQKPILIGYSSGATLAYGAFAQAPAGSYKAAFSFGFSPDIIGAKPWCKAPGINAAPIAHPQKGWLFTPPQKLPGPWIVMQGMQDQATPPAAAKRFTASVGGARYIALPGVGHGFAAQAKWMPQFLAQLSPLLTPTTPAASTQASADVAGLPLTIVADPAARKTDLMAVMYSGDGGWAGLDRAVATQLAASGVPVVGVDSLDYFWTARTPGEAGNDLARIISHFRQAWQRPRVILLGYSFGADDLPYIVGALPPALRPAISRVSLLGLSPTADFQFHLTSWLDLSNENAKPTIPAIERLKGLPMQCIRGSDESDSACPGIPAGYVSQVTLPGGHHFEGNAELIAQTVLHGLTS